MNQGIGSGRIAYPPTRRDDSIVDTQHGVDIPDPYRWLEDPDSPETRAWVDAQNALAHRHLSGIPARNAIHERLVALTDRPRRGAPWRQGGWWFQLRNEGLQNQSVLWTRAHDPAEADFEAGWHPLLDVNMLSAEGTTSITGLVPSKDGRLLAYGLSESGSDWIVWQVRDVATGEDLPDRIDWSKFAGVAWLPDGRSFVYATYKAPIVGEEFTAESRDQEIRLHRLGTDPKDDPLVYSRPDHPRWGFRPEITHDGRWLVLSVWEGTEPKNRIHVAPIEGSRIGQVRPLLDLGDARYEFLGVIRSFLWFLTDHAAPRERIIRVSPEGGLEPEKIAVLPEQENRIQSAQISGGRTSEEPGEILVRTLHHASSRVLRFSLDGDPIGDIAFPEVHGTVTELTSARGHEEVFLTFESPVRPVEVLRLDRSSGRAERVHGPVTSGRAAAGSTSGPSAADSSTPELVIEQVFVESDRVRVPVFLLRRTDLRPNGKVPTLLHGYGGFDVPTQPTHSVPFQVWAERGGLVAIACLRGGGEYGREWHDDGRLANKQHVFDDAIAVASWLTGSGKTVSPDLESDEALPGNADAGAGPSAETSPWTSLAHLGIHGRSNGGLLVGACMTQRPDLFGACIAEVGVMDMLRFHLFTIGWAWTSDYGSVESPQEFRTLLAYSPLHNLNPGICYPPTLITTGDHDDRVLPGHSFKFAAELQHVQQGATGCTNPTLIRIDVAAGHGAGKPISKQIEERADVLAFLAAALRP